MIKCLGKIKGKPYGGAFTPLVRPRVQLMVKGSRPVRLKMKFSGKVKVDTGCYGGK